MLLATGFLSALCYAGLWLGPSPGGPSVTHFLGLMAPAFVLYAVACGAARRLTSRVALPVIIGGALLFRVLVTGPVIHDDDIYRYHWDGRVLAAGHNPYRYAPNDHRLARLRDDAWQHVSYKWVKSIYPPLTEALSAATHLIWPSSHRIRVLAAAFDLATLIPILLLLRRLALPPTLAIVYAWNPLPIKEFANSGHLDSIAIFLAMWSLYALSSRRPVRAGALWGLGFLAKTWPLMLLPLYLRRHRMLGLVPFVIVVAAGVLPFAGAGADLLAGSRAYARVWEFNSGLFALAKSAAEARGLDGMLAAKALGTVLWLVVAGLVVISRDAGDADTLRRAGLLIALALVLSPVCNPWYVCWLLPILCVHRSPAWLAFTALVMLSYLYYEDPALDPPARIVEYGVLAALVLWEHLTRNPHRLWAGLGVHGPVSAAA